MEVALSMSVPLWAGYNRRSARLASRAGSPRGVSACERLEFNPDLFDCPLRWKFARFFKSALVSNVSLIPACFTVL